MISVFVIFVFMAISDWTHLIALLIDLALIVTAIFGKLVFLEKMTPLVLVGNASYSIYLLHQNIGYMLIRLLSREINYYLSIALTMLIMTGAGILFYFLLEKNIKKIVNNIYKRL